MRTIFIWPRRVSSTMRLTSASANRPTTATRKLTPCCSSGISKVKRGRPLCRSMPTVAIASPRKTEISPLASELPVSALTVVRANSIRAKYSVGPNFSARSASGAATKVSAVTPSVPAMKELKAAIASAAPARPWRASG